jgi:aminomuconate-semialdehyde/2-hydroxymuconate-6-semialdehyde dehydrogenase
MHKVLNFIGNEYREPLGGEWLNVTEPATGSVYAQLAASGPRDIDAAFSAARTAWPDWSGLEAEHRAAILNRIADLLEQNLQTFAEAESRDSGKPIDLARSVDIPRAVTNFRFFAAAASQFSSESHSMGRHAINYTLRQPLGVTGCISPWNLPLYLFSWKIAPALACGNTVVAKPSEVTPLTASMLGDICIKAGLPCGVLNIIQGDGINAGASLVRHPDLKALSFTGSTRTGAQIATTTAERFIKLSLEMGGKNATLVFADCNLEKVADQVVRSAFSNQGQICLCGSRILIEDGIYGQFREMLLRRVRELRIGDPSVEGTQQGAIVSQLHFDKILGCLELAIEEGGDILCGGKPVNPGGRCENGWFIEPALIEGLGNNCRTNQEEIFGPVATLQSFSSEEEALALANASEYGLACSIWSNNLNRCHRVAEQLNCGIVWINCWLQRDLRTPFGGVGNSGLGREGGLEAMRFFTEPKNVCIEYG